MKNIIKYKYKLASLMVLASLLVSCFDRTFDMESPEFDPIEISDFSPKTGYPYSEITIHGSNFGIVPDPIRISFNGVEVDHEDISEYTDTYIKVAVPAAATTGPLKVTWFTQVIESAEEFVVTPIPDFDGIIYDFDENDGGWKVETGSAEVSDGFLNVTLDSNGEANLSFEDIMDFNTLAHPLLAVRMSRIGDVELSFETDLGVFSHAGAEYGTENYTGIINGDIYYWDLSKGQFTDSEGNVTGMNPEGITSCDIVRFNIKSAIASGYKVDYIRSFESLVELNKYANANQPHGKYVWEFDYVTSIHNDCDWVDHQNSVRQENSSIITTYDKRNNSSFFYSYRNGKLTTGGTNEPGDADWQDNIVYNPEYPIYAMRTTKPADCELGRDWKNMRGYGDTQGQGLTDGRGNQTATIIDGGNVLYWDLSEEVIGTEMFTDPFTGKKGTAIWDTFGFQGSTDDAYLGTEWQVHWVISFKTVDELNEYIANGN